MPRAPTPIDAEVADKALSRLEIDALGLDAMDRRYLTMIADLYGGGPVGVETLAAGLSEPRDTIEDVIEPYLIQLGLIARTARGRCLNGRGYAHLGLPAPQGGQAGLFDQEERASEIDAPSVPLLAAAALAAAAPLFAPSRPAAPGRARLFEGLELAVPAGPRRRLLDAAGDDRAQPQRLWLDRPEQRRQGPAARLLLRLSDGLERPGD